MCKKKYCNLVGNQMKYVNDRTYTRNYGREKKINFKNMLLSYINFVT